MSYVQVLIHGIFRTYGSQPTLPTDKKIEFLYKDIWGIIENKGGHLYRINSMPDHVHILFTIPSTITLADMMQAIKGSTSRTLKYIAGFEDFRGWGNGYAAISHNLKDKYMIISYIKNQQEHHKDITFKDEYIQFAKDMGMEIDERDWAR